MCVLRVSLFIIPRLVDPSASARQNLRNIIQTFLQHIVCKFTPWFSPFGSDKQQPCKRFEDTEWIYDSRMLVFLRSAKFWIGFCRSCHGYSVGRIENVSNSSVTFVTSGTQRSDIFVTSLTNVKLNVFRCLQSVSKYYHIHCSLQNKSFYLEVRAGFFVTFRFVKSWKCTDTIDWRSLELNIFFKQVVIIIDLVHSVYTHVFDCNMQVKQ